ncbi:MAG: hypothetical protein GY915_07750 [bacterium]|nr:hypothetical protein [bacterium]
MNRLARFLVCVFLLGIIALPVHATTKLLGSFGDWRAYVTTAGGKKVYYISSFPKKEEGNYTKRGDVYFLVTHRPDRKSFHVISADAGYTLKKDSEVTLTIDNQKFALFTDGETAWAQDNDLDKKIARALTKGSRMVIQATSSRGTKTKDTYSLKGSGAAMRCINKPCGLAK